MSFGIAEFTSRFTKDQTITPHHDGNAAATFNVTAVMPQGSLHTVALDKAQVSVQARADASVRVILDVAAASAGNSDAFRDALPRIRRGKFSLEPLPGAPWPQKALTHAQCRRPYPGDYEGKQLSRNNAGLCLRVMDLCTTAQVFCYVIEDDGGEGGIRTRVRGLP